MSAGEAFIVVYDVRPWGVEPQSMEPESIILSIELRARVVILLHRVAQN